MWQPISQFPPSYALQFKRILGKPKAIVGRQVGCLSFIQQDALEKYALELYNSKELVGLGAYRNMPEGILVAVEYIESAPTSNPTQTRFRKFRDVGAALLAFGIQLSIDYGYGGTIYLKAKTSELREHLHSGFWSYSIQPCRSIHSPD